MAEIVDLAIERGYRQGRERNAFEPHLGPAQVVLYTGIRYERTPDPEPDKPKRKPKNRND